MRTTARKHNAVIPIILMACFTAGLMVIGTAAVDGQDASYRAVIIRGAGHLPNLKAPEGPDAITNATSEPGNTYVFSERLAEELEKNGIKPAIVDYTECSDLTCVTYTNAAGARRAVDFVILAGPSYNRYLPKQLLKLLPLLGEKLASFPGVVCSSMISGNYTYRVVDTMVNTDVQLREIGVKTVPGLVFNSDVVQQELDEDVRDFVSKLVGAAKGK